MSSLRLRVEPREAPAFERALDRNALVIGRAPTVDVLLADSLVSRQHARLYRQADAWWVEDLGARNRTYLNDHELVAPERLHSGDHLRIGHTLIRILDEAGDVPTDVTPLPGGIDEPVFLKTTSSSPTGTAATDARNDHRQGARMHLLNQIHHALATPISLSELLDLILERCFEVLRPEQGVILLRGRDGELREAATRRLAGETADILVSRKIVEEVADRGQSALVLDAARDARFAASESMMVAGVRSVVAAPLMDAEGTLGMIALYSRISVRQFSQEDLDLLISLASAAALRVRNVALTEEATARRVLEHELLLAHDMQMAMLPREIPARPEIAVAAVLKPARSVGGDLYDFSLQGDSLWFIVGDVSGKGVAAALYMAVAKTLFRATAQGTSLLADVVAMMNRELARDNERSIFVTAIVGWLDCSSGKVLLCDAGHNPPLLLRVDGVVRQPVMSKSMALGIIDDLVFRTTALQLAAGDMLLLYTDGMTEARNPGGTMFEIERLERALANRAGQDPRAVVAGLLSDVQQFASGAPPEDDLTVLAIRYQGSPNLS